MTTAHIILGTAALYAGCGLVFAAAFLTRGVGRVDPAAAGASVWVRLLLAPGCVALWPVLLQRWRDAREVKS